jgi:hypothetical protein
MMRMMRRFLAMLLIVGITLLLAAACDHNSPTAPDDTANLGTLSGSVSIGPNCPGAQNCAAPPEAFAARKIVVFDAGRTKLLHTLDLTSQGRYLIKLAPGTYVVDFTTSFAADRTSDLPKSVTISRAAVTTVDITIDTGLR